MSSDTQEVARHVKGVIGRGRRGSSIERSDIYLSSPTPQREGMRVNYSFIMALEELMTLSLQ